MTGVIRFSPKPEVHVFACLSRLALLPVSIDNKRNRPIKMLHSGERQPSTNQSATTLREKAVADVW